MIRAKTLLASVVIVGTAAITFALNSSHDGFVPGSGASNTFASRPALDGELGSMPSKVIAHLPKLAPPPQPAPQPVHGVVDLFQPTVVDLDDDTVTGIAAETTENAPSTASDDSPETSDIVDASTGIDVVTEVINSNRTVSTRAARLSEGTSVDVVPMPLPTRSPRLARHLSPLKVVTLSPAAQPPKASLKRRIRLKASKQQSRQRAEAKLKRPRTPEQKPSKLSGLTTKPVRHRKPFDVNRN